MQKCVTRAMAVNLDAKVCSFARGFGHVFGRV